MGELQLIKHTNNHLLPSPQLILRNETSAKLSNGSKRSASFHFGLVLTGSAPDDWISFTRGSHPYPLNTCRFTASSNTASDNVMHESGLTRLSHEPCPGKGKAAEISNEKCILRTAEINLGHKEESCLSLHILCDSLGTSIT